MSQPIYDSFARVYDLQHSNYADDLPLYLQLARELAPGQAVLELGAGSGRVMLPLLRAGRRVVGVDESPEMLDIAREHIAALSTDAASSELHCADARTIRLDERFGMVVIALNTFLHNRTREDQLATLRTAREHLAPGGFLVVDLPPNDELSFQPDDDDYQIEATLIDPSTQTRITKSVASSIFWATQEQELTYRIVEERAGQEHEQIISFRLRHVFRYEMDLLLQLAGFDEPRWLGDYVMNEYADDSERMICTAQCH
ncbi:MAG: class I SAM-dependent methyltransferase [Chloroflexi bacterium]|nr:class I SAM-dependent methyltransferase [Chloroflexota bacterium]